MVAGIRAFADKHVERFISRKFLAWLTATGLCVWGVVSSSDWVAVTLAYIGTQALVDMATAWKHGPRG
jgi:dolichyl-phosphate-mannose--protein O-mannosyl transferase